MSTVRDARLARAAERTAQRLHPPRHAQAPAAVRRFDAVRFAGRRITSEYEAAFVMAALFVIAAVAFVIVLGLIALVETLPAVVTLPLAAGMLLAAAICTWSANR